MQETCSLPSQQCSETQQVHTTVQSPALLAPELHSMTGTAQDKLQDSKPGLQAGSSPMHGPVAVDGDSASQLQPLPAAQPCSLQQQAQQGAHEDSAQHNRCSLADASDGMVASRTSLQGSVWLPDSCLQGKLSPKVQKRAYTAGRAKHKTSAMEDRLSGVSSRGLVRGAPVSEPMPKPAHDCVCASLLRKLQCHGCSVGICCSKVY